MKTAFRAAVLVLPLSACASIFNGSTHTLHVQSTVPKTAVIVTNKKQEQVANVVTPAAVLLKNEDAPYVLAFREPKGGQQSYEVQQGVSPWVFANLILGGIIGFGIDAATGSIHVLKPDTVNMDMKTGVNLAFPDQK